MIARPLQVLIADVDPRRFHAVRQRLQASARQPVDCSWAADADSARQSVLADRHDVTLLTHPLGAVSGVDLLAEANERHCSAPIILLAPQGAGQLDEAALRAGAADFLLLNEASGPLLERSIRYAIDRAEMLRALRTLANHDSLTGLPNRRDLDRRLHTEVVRANTYGRDLSLILLDIDNFKDINDRYGHPVGDAVLRWLAAVLEGEIRASDQAARLGGDEYALILPETGPGQGFKIAERLRRSVAEEACTIPCQTRVLEMNVTVSVGISALGSAGRTDLELLAAADTALYAAKRMGKNRCAASMAAPGRHDPPDIPLREGPRRIGAELRDGDGNVYPRAEPEVSLAAMVSREAFAMTPPSRHVPPAAPDFVQNGGPASEARP